MSRYLRPEGGLLGRIYSNDDSAPQVRRLVPTQAETPGDHECLVSEVLELMQRVKAELSKTLELRRHLEAEVPELRRRLEALEGKRQRD